tara:strand:- start:1157 stop:3139 length:1983 start_codon:yes stop_codon:yes gene_type:complete
MNLTEDKVKLVGYTFAISLLIPPNVGLNFIGLNFEDLPLIFLFAYLFYFKIRDFDKNNLDKFDIFFFIFFSGFIFYTNIFVKNKGLFNQTNFRFYFYFFLSYLVINIYNSNKNKIINIFEPLYIVMIVNCLIIFTKFEIKGNLNGWISNNTSENNIFTSGRLGGLQGGGPNVIGILSAVSAIVCIFKILSAVHTFNYLKTNKFNSFILLISLFNLYLTYSRGSYLAFGIGCLILLLITDNIKRKFKFYVFVVLSVLSLVFINLNPSIFLKQTNRGFLTEIGVKNVNLFEGTGGGNYIKSVYKEYLVSLDENILKEKFNITYSDSEKNSNKKSITNNEETRADGYLKLKFDYRDRYLPRSVISFYFSNDGTEWEQIGFNHTNGELINLIENDSYFEVGGWGDGQSNDGSFLNGNIKQVVIKSSTEIYKYEFPKYKRGLDYFILTPRLRNVYRGEIQFTDSGVLLERPRDYWLALPNYINLSKQDFEVVVNLEIEGIPKGNETLFSQSSILRINNDFNDQSWKWSIVQGRMYFFWIENVDNGYINYLGGKSLRSGNLISNNGRFDTSNIPEFNLSQYDEITTSHNGFLTMSVEYGLFPVLLILFSFLYSIIKNFEKKHAIELTIFFMILLQNLTNDLIYSPDVSIYFWIMPMYLLKNIIKSR